MTCHVGFVVAPVYVAAFTGPGLHLVPLWLWFGYTNRGLLIRGMRALDQVRHRAVNCLFAFLLLKKRIEWSGPRQMGYHGVARMLQLGQCGMATTHWRLSEVCGDQVDFIGR